MSRFLCKQGERYVGWHKPSNVRYPGPEGTHLPYTVMARLPNAEGSEIRLGGVGSALAPHPTLPDHFYTLSDRGPNAATPAGRKPSCIIFPLPTYNPRIHLYRLSSTSMAELVDSILLKDPKGRPVTGLPNKNYGATGETPYAMDGSVVTLDPDGDGIAGLLQRVGAVRAEVQALGQDAIWVTHAGVLRAMALLDQGLSMLHQAPQWPREVVGWGEWEEFLL